MKTKMPKFGAVPVALFLEESLTLADVRVYAVLAMFQGHNEESYPSRESIAKNANISVESVSRAISHLVEMGWAERDQRGFGKSNIYRVMVETDEDRNATGDISRNATGDAQEMPPMPFPSIPQKDHSKRGAKEKDAKHKHGEYQHVLLSSSELEKLKTSFPLDWEQRIKTMDEGIELKGYKYKSHYLAILKWAERDRAKSTPLFPDQDAGRFVDPLKGQINLRKP